MKRWAAVAVVVATASSCRGRPSGSPPIHVIRDMFDQPKLRPQAEFAYFDDRAAMRAPIGGTVAREDLRDETAQQRGRDGKGWAKRVPVLVDPTLLDRGEERFAVFCAPCHDKAGSGRGTVALRGFTRPVDLASENSRGLSDGEIFDVATNGARTMPAHRSQIPAADRWAIVAWVRVVQRSQHAMIDDLVAETVPSIEPEGAAP